MADEGSTGRIKSDDINIKKTGSRWQKVFLIASAAVFVIGIGVLAFFIMGNTGIGEDRIERIVDYGTVLEGVSIDGLDISGMSVVEASQTTEHLGADLLASANFTLDIDGETVEYDAAGLELYTDYDDVFTQAVRYGHVGTFEERKQEKETALAQGIDFDIAVYADEAKISSIIQTLKNEMDAEASDASFIFMPWGYFEDGTAYEPDAEEMITTLAKKDEYVYPEGLVTIPDEQMPSDLRYEYYQDDYYWEEHYGEQYKPKDANISRFLYQSESKGVNIDKAATVELIMQAVQNGGFGVIEVPAQITQAGNTLEAIAAQTQLIASWTSSYHDHYSVNRTYNVGKMSYIISGVVLQPGETWSINEQAGERNGANGWKKAAGIESGAFTQQYGGGVCQVSSTLFNAALRAGLDQKRDIDHANHSIISDYIPIGLDATISSKGPDLKLTNPYDTPLYIVSYLNGVEENLTIEIYGTLPVDEKYGQVIYTFTSRKSSTGETPAYTYIYNATATPDGDPIAPGGQSKYVSSRPKTTAKVYMHILDLEGNELEEKFLFTATYRAYTGVIYVNGQDPSATPVPDPATTP